MGEEIKGGRNQEHVLGAVDPSPTAHTQMLYEHEKNVGLIQARREVKITPKYGGQFKYGDILRIEIPTVDMLDPDHFCISLDLVLESGEGNLQTASDVYFRHGNLAGDAAEPTSEFNSSGNFTQVKPANDPPNAPFIGKTRWSNNKIRHSARAGGGTPSQAQVYDQLLQDTVGPLRSDPTGAGTYLTTSSGVQKMFSRVVLKQGSITIEDKQKYNYLFPIQSKAHATHDFRKTSAFINEGLRDEDTREHFWTSCVWSSYTAGKRYVIRPLLGLFDAGKFLPTSLAGQFTLEFYFEKPENFLISSMHPEPIDFADIDEEYYNNFLTTDQPQEKAFAAFPHPNYYIKNVRAHCPFVVPEESYTDKLMSKVQGGGLEIHYETYSTHERNIQNTWRGGSHMNFQDRAVSLKGAFLVFVTDNDIDDVGTDLAIFKSLGMQYYQWKIGSEYIPPQPVVCEEEGLGHGSAEAYVMLEKYLNRFADVTFHGEIDHFNFARRRNAIDNDTPQSVYSRRGYAKEHSFLLPLQLEKVPGFISGYNALASNTDIEITYRLDGAGNPSHNAGYYACQPTTQPPFDEADDIQRGDILEGLAPNSNGENTIYIKKPNPTNFIMLFFAHKDVLFVLKDLGAVEIRM